MLVRNVLIEQRKRLVGSLMQYVESEVYPSLTQQQRAGLRNKVLTSVGAYHDVCLDLLKASVDEGLSVMNDEAIRALANLHDEMRHLRRDLTRDT